MLQTLDFLETPLSQTSVPQPLGGQASKLSYLSPPAQIPLATASFGICQPSETRLDHLIRGSASSFHEAVRATTVGHGQTYKPGSHDQRSGVHLGGSVAVVVLRYIAYGLLTAIKALQISNLTWTDFDEILSPFGLMSGHE